MVSSPKNSVKLEGMRQLIWNDNKDRKLYAQPHRMRMVHDSKVYPAILFSSLLHRYYNLVAARCFYAWEYGPRSQAMDRFI